MVWWPRMDCPKLWISKNVQFRHMCGAFGFWSNFGWPKIWANPCWSQHCIALACYPRLIMVINCNNEVCLEGILAKESSARTKDFLLCRDLQWTKQTVIYCENITLFLHCCLRFEESLTVILLWWQQTCASYNKCLFHYHLRKH